MSRLRSKCVAAAARPQKMDEIFTQFDSDGSGNITYDEVL